MGDERLTVIERITFMDNGSSLHVWTFPDGTTREETFAVSPVMFQKDGPYWGLATAREGGITRIERRSK